MGTLLIFLIVVLSGVICAVAGFWFYRAFQERKQNFLPQQSASRPVRNEAWDRAVQAARNRNW